MRNSCCLANHCLFSADVNWNLSSFFCLSHPGCASFQLNCRIYAEYEPENSNSHLNRRFRIVALRPDGIYYSGNNCYIVELWPSSLVLEIVELVLGGLGCEGIGEAESGDRVVDGGRAGAGGR